MSNLTVQQVAAIAAGAPIRQLFVISTPLDAAHSSYAPITIDDGLMPSGAAPKKRVVKCGTRTHEVWNPHPMDDARPRAVRYSVECANADGYFHRKIGSIWNPYGLYDADPAECFLTHKIQVMVSGSWQSIAHMDFVGRIIDVSYSGGGSMVKASPSVGTTAPGVAPRTATITCEQVGAWEHLRRVFTKDDAVLTNDLISITVPGTALSLASISPSTRTAGSGTFTLTLTGTGYSTVTQIYVAGAPKATTYVNSTTVTCSVGASVIATAGTVPVYAYIPGPGGATSATLNITVT